MRLSALNGNSIALTIDGYQFPDRTPVRVMDHDANWLMVAGHVQTADLSWRFRRPCLLRWEAARLEYWLKSIVLGTVAPLTVGNGPGHLWFTEQDIDIRLTSVSDETVSLTFVFSAGSAPADDTVRVPEQVVPMELPRTAIAEGAEAWARDLEPWPVR